MNTEKVLRHKAICDELNKLYEKKNHDYGDSFHQTFIEEGLAMTRIRLGDKFSRFKTLSRLTNSDSDQQQVTDESIRDTLMDLANYAIMTILEMDGGESSCRRLGENINSIYVITSNVVIVVTILIADIPVIFLIPSMEELFRMDTR